MEKDEGDLCPAVDTREWLIDDDDDDDDDDPHLLSNTSYGIKIIMHFF